MGVPWAFRERLVGAAHEQFHGRLTGVSWLLSMGSSMSVPWAAHETPMDVKLKPEEVWQPLLGTAMAPFRGVPRAYLRRSTGALLVVGSSMAVL